MGNDVGECCDACRQFGDQTAVRDAPASEPLRASYERVVIRVSEKGGASFDVKPTGPEVRVGRVKGNDIVLPKGNVSKRASRFVFKDDKIIVIDENSTCGTYVNGRKITAPAVVGEDAKIYVGDFVLQIVRTD